MKRDSCNIQALIQKFFLKWLMGQRNVSPETVKSYRDTFRIFLEYLAKSHKIKPSAMTIDCLAAECLLGFLESLEKERGNSPKTINVRLAAISSFLKFLSFEIPEYSSLLNRSLMIPYRKFEKRSMDFLTKEEFKALIDSCELNTMLGRRDQLMLLLLYNTGVRVSELLGIETKDIVKGADGRPSYIHVRGKGRKERDVPLWKNTSEFMGRFMAEHEPESNPRLFVNRIDGALTRSGVRYRLQCLIKKAAVSAPSLSRKNVTPHTFRHTTALNLLQSGIDISTIAIWLGHESILTTHKYMESDLEMKRRTLEKLQEPGCSASSFEPDDALLAFLDSL
jgi:site-specific recombinase XerD